MNRKFTLKEPTDSLESFKISESIYKISLILKEAKQEQQLSTIVESIYKIALSLKETKQEQQLVSSYINGVKRILQSEYFSSKHNEIINNIQSFSSFGQLQSKFWLIDILKKNQLFNLGTVFICAGWYGLLPFVLLNDKNFTIEQFFNFEKDPLSVKVSEDFNREFVKKDWKFKASLNNILDIDYDQTQFNTLKANGTIQALTISADTIINTSCEHIKQFAIWWFKLPKKKLIILQSNNYTEHTDHTNCVSSLEEFKKQAPMKLIYEGILDLQKYKRFMLIGYKK